MKPKNMTHYERARKARDEYEALTGKRPPRPNKKADLDKLLVDVEFRRLAGILNDDAVLDEPIPAGPPPADPNNFYQREFAVGNYLKMFQLDAVGAYDMLDFLTKIKPKISDVLEKEVGKLGPIKFAIAVQVLLMKDDEFTTPVFRTSQIDLLSGHEIAGLLDGVPSFLQERLEEFLNLGSGWILNKVEVVWIDIAKYQPLSGSSYLLLPKELRDKKCIINPINKYDNLCFYYCVLISKIVAPHHRERISWYKDDLEELL